MDPQSLAIQNTCRGWGTIFSRSSIVSLELSCQYLERACWYLTIQRYLNITKLNTGRLVSPVVHPMRSKLLVGSNFVLPHNAHHCAKRFGYVGIPTPWGPTCHTHHTSKLLDSNDSEEKLCWSYHRQIIIYLMINDYISSHLDSYYWLLIVFNCASKYGMLIFHGDMLGKIPGMPENAFTVTNPLLAFRKGRPNTIMAWSQVSRLDVRDQTLSQEESESPDSECEQAEASEAPCRGGCSRTLWANKGQVFDAACARAAPEDAASGSPHVGLTSWYNHATRPRIARTAHFMKPCKLHPAPRIAWNAESMKPCKAPASNPHLHKNTATTKTQAPKQHPHKNTTTKTQAPKHNLAFWALSAIWTSCDTWRYWCNFFSSSSTNSIWRSNFGWNDVSHHSSQLFHVP